MCARLTEPQVLHRDVLTVREEHRALDRVRRFGTPGASVRVDRRRVREHDGDLDLIGVSEIRAAEEEPAQHRRALGDGLGAQEAVVEQVEAVLPHLPPPVAASATAAVAISSGNSYPPLLFQKPLRQCVVATATTMTAGYQLGQNFMAKIQGGQVLVRSPFVWKSGMPVILRLEIRRSPEGAWTAEARAWALES